MVVIVAWACVWPWRRVKGENDGGRRPRRPRCFLFLCVRERKGVGVAACVWFAEQCKIRRGVCAERQKRRATPGCAVAPSETGNADGEQRERSGAAPLAPHSSASEKRCVLFLPPRPPHARPRARPWRALNRTHACSSPHSGRSRPLWPVRGRVPERPLPAAAAAALDRRPASRSLRPPGLASPPLCPSMRSSRTRRPLPRPSFGRS